ncbi:MAG TPA: hypothetical protein VGX75_15155 [bacterium]|nr:hypothetical protein [bacterium]
MLSSAQVDRDPSVLAGVLWLAGLVALCFLLGHFFMVWDGRFAWGSGPSGAPDPAAGCPYPFCGTWILW